MKKKFMLLMILATSASFADTYKGILTDGDFMKLMTSVSLDEFNTALLNNSSIAYNDRHEASVFTPSAPISPQTEFAYPNGYALSNISLKSNNPFVQETVVLDTSDDKGAWVGINELSNPYNPQAGAINVTQNMSIQEHSMNYSQTASTATSLGWDVSFGVSYEYKQALNGTSQGVTVSVEAGVNGNTTQTQTTTTGYTDIAKSFTVPVPAGCKAVVTQSLGSSSFGGEYSFSAVLAQAQMKFTTMTGSPSSHYINSGYVDVADLVRLGLISQNALTVDKAGNLLILGRGTYVAKGASNYTVNVAYEEAIPGTNYCFPPSEQTFNSALVEDNIRSSGGPGSIPVVKKTSKGFSYTLAYNPTHRKVAYQKIK